MASSPTTPNCLEPLALYIFPVGEEPRKKRAHRKSRLGCEACKRRRVKCDEGVPSCTHCVKRKEKCVRRKIGYAQIPPAPSHVRPPFAPAGGPDSPVNLMHLELLHHFEHTTQPTLSFPEVWHAVLQQAFQEEFIMSSVLCMAATHLTILRPDNSTYALASDQLLSKSLQLLRESLNRPFDTCSFCDGLSGVTVLTNYISWCKLNFLDGQLSSQHTGTAEFMSPHRTPLDISQDPLLLLSPGVVQVFLRSLPVFLAKDSAFLKVGQQHPRANIEQCLLSQGLQPAQYVEPFMRLWADPQHQNYQSTLPGGRDIKRSEWDIAVGLGDEYTSWGARENIKRCTSASADLADPTTYGPKALEQINEPLLAMVDPVNEPHCTTGGESSPRGEGTETPPELDRAQSVIRNPEGKQRLLFERVVRRLSPILCCLLAPSGDFTISAVPKRADMKRFLFAFPVLCCGPMIEMAAAGDTRAYVVLYHFYRAARILLDPEESWWACERSRVMEVLLLNELKARGLSCCLRD